MQEKRCPKCSKPLDKQKRRLTTRVQLTSDGFKPYIREVDDTFGTEVD
jgi:hypothetical protein